MGVVIIGGGMAGGNAAATLRDEGYEGEIVILGNEPGVPFGRPPLSKGYLRREEELSGWFVREPDWYADNGVELRTDVEVAGVEPNEGAVVSAAGERIPYDELLIATGGRTRTPSMAGADLQGVLQLRTQAESDRIQAAAASGGRIVIAGMSFIGAEVAASLTQMGAQVTTVFPEPAPLLRVLGEEIGGVLGRLHSEKGVELVAGDSVAAFEGASVLERVRTESGRTIECSAAIAAVGIQPNVEVLEGSGAALDNGVLVDELCRTNLPNVFACGDVANMSHPLFGRLRVEHYNNAEKHGRAAALAMLGRGRPYDYMFSFWSDQYEHKLEYVGFARRWDEVVIRGSLEEAKLVGLYIQDRRLLAAVGLNRGGDPEVEPDSELAACAKLIAGRQELDASALADESTDLWSLVT
ncbi:MAG TPA: FAD-dependent oxidoreductase [Candidatus Dormibacteraeota bacterium]